MDWFDAFMEWSFRLVFMPLVVIFVVATGLGLITSPLWIYALVTSPPPTTIALPIDSWRCSKLETHTYTQMMMVGKVMVPQVMTEEVCVQYEMKRG
jgi:hypothetical protein